MKEKNDICVERRRPHLFACLILYGVPRVIPSGISITSNILIECRRIFVYHSVRLNDVPIGKTFSIQLSFSPAVSSAFREKIFSFSNFS